MAQMDMNQCAEQDWEAADAELNARLQDGRWRGMKAMDANLPADLQGGAEALRDAQRAWITFRDTNCEAEGYRDARRSAPSRC